MSDAFSLRWHGERVHSERTSSGDSGIRVSRQPYSFSSIRAAIESWAVQQEVTLVSTLNHKTKTVLKVR